MQCTILCSNSVILHETGVFTPGSHQFRYSSGWYKAGLVAGSDLGSPPTACKQGELPSTDTRWDARAETMSREHSVLLLKAVNWIMCARTAACSFCGMWQFLLTPSETLKEKGRTRLFTFYCIARTPWERNSDFIPNTNVNLLPSRRLIAEQLEVPWILSVWNWLSVWLLHLFWFTHKSSLWSLCITPPRATLES